METLNSFLSVLHEIMNSLLPVFLVVLLGGVLRRTGFLTAELVRGTNRLCYWIALPSMLFYETARSPSSFTGHGAAAGVIVLAILLALGLGYGVTQFLRQPPATTATVVHACFRGNLAFIGFPVLFYAGGVDDARGAVSALLLGIGTLTANVLSVIVLLVGQHSKIDRRALRIIGQQLVTNPLIIACVSGALWSAMRTPLPVAAGNTLKAIGQMASPLALLGIGATLQSTRLGRTGLRNVWVASVVKVLPVPLVALVLARMAGLSPWETRAVVVYMACPTATVSYLLVELIGGDRVVAAGAVVLSTMLSFASLALALALTTQT